MRRHLIVSLVAVLAILATVGVSWAGLIQGTARNDTLKGTARADTLNGNAGNDKPGVTALASISWDKSGTHYECSGVGFNWNATLQQ